MADSKTQRPDGPRPTIVGADTGPEKPFPLKMRGKVVSGFGRGSKELGIPTANIPVEGVSWIEEAQSGVYFGWAGVQLPADHPDLSSSTSPAGPSTSLPGATIITTICPISPPQQKQEQGWRLFPMVMSIGYNPFYKNKVRSAEVHVLRKFAKDFYGSEMNILIMGFIRPEYDYKSLEALVDDIKMDITVADGSLGREGWVPKDCGYLWGEDA